MLRKTTSIISGSLAIAACAALIACGDSGRSVEAASETSAEATTAKPVEETPVQPVAKVEAPAAPAPIPTRDVGSGFFIETTGCNSAQQAFEIQVPDFERLDPNYSGPVAGIEFIQTTGNGKRYGLRNVSINGNGILRFELFCEGAGDYVHPPIGGGWCNNGGGGSIGYAVKAHYR